MRVVHTFLPICDEQSEILILGTFPSVKSREGEFYYHHPQNRFWRVMAAILEQPVPQSIAEKKDMLLRGKIALWDVIAACEIEGSADSSIRDVTPNDIGALVTQTSIRRIFCNGTKAYELYRKYCAKTCPVNAVRLPSTSPANAAWSLERLIQEWKSIVFS